MELIELLSTGLLNLSVPALIVTTLLLTHITVVSVTVYFHRFSAHRSLALHPALQHFFRFWLWFATGMVTKEWTAVHRCHHAHCETEDDPHSPQVQGLAEILFAQTEAYQRSAADAETIRKFGGGTPDDWLERNLYTKYSYLGIALLFLLDVLLFGVIGITVWAVQMVWIPMLGGMVNGVGHYSGYRNFECPDAARNILPWGILIGGEELHNNHHTYPNSAKMSVKPWEFDLGWCWIRLFKALGLAHSIHTGPVVVRSDARPSSQELNFDASAVIALANDRFNVMAKYADRVIGPTIKAYESELSGAKRRLVRRGKKLLQRQDLLIDEAGRAQLQQLLSVPEFRTVYELRLKLQSIWEKRTGKVDELTRELRQWCKDAQATGSESLIAFVDDLRSYALPAPNSI